MIKVFGNPYKILNYHPLAIKKKIKGFLLAKKIQPIFIEYFSGEFDNQSQTLVDYKIWKINNSWGKHEHIHCSISYQKSYDNFSYIFKASYYFPFKDPITFRDRIYIFYPSLFSTRKKVIFQMEILQNYSIMNFNPSSHVKPLKKYSQKIFRVKNCLNRCTIFWRVYFSENITRKKKPIFFGELQNGGCTIFSRTGVEFLNVRDNLTLEEYSLWVNDRGFDEKGELKYGNSEKISYKLEKVSRNNFLNCTIRKIKKKYK